jgi:hypothetical protein
MNTLRAYQPSDLAAISKIWEDHHSSFYGLPDRRAAVIDAVVENDGKIIGYGQVRLFAEAMLFLDMDAPLRSRIQALQQLMREAFRGTERAGLREIYAFIQDPDFSLLMQKHFHFVAADKPGELLVKEL